MRIPNEGLKLELLFDLSESYTKDVTEVIKSSKNAMNLIRTFRFKSAISSFHYQHANLS
jgi:hypothetical protein